MSITTNVKHRVRTTGSEHQGQNSISDPDKNLGFVFFHKVYKNTSYLGLIVPGSPHPCGLESGSGYMGQGKFCLRVVR